MSGFFCWNVSIIFLVISSSTPVCESHHSTVAWAVPACAGAAVAAPAAGAAVAPPPVEGVAAPPHAARSEAPASPAAPLRNLRRLIAGLPVPMVSSSFGYTYLTAVRKRRVMAQRVERFAYGQKALEPSWKVGVHRVWSHSRDLEGCVLADRRSWQR